jgi:hypothetical protein
MSNILRAKRQSLSYVEQLYLQLNSTYVRTESCLKKRPKVYVQSINLEVKIFDPKDTINEHL